MYHRFIFLPAVLFLAGFLQAQTGDQVLMRVGKTDVSTSEFKYIYEKNNGAAADYSEKNLTEYLELYTKFKLKVEKAKQLRLDTISALISELDGYRKQLASSYLIDKEVTDFLLRELYDRMKYDVEFSHIFIPVSEGTRKAAKDEAILKLKEAKTKIAGGMSFEDAARQYSQDKTTSEKGGAMGYFTAKLPSGFYEFETALYTVPVGQVSDVVHSRIGYHLIKVTNKRPARGVLEAAHILIKQEQKNLADSIYNLVKSGKDFDVLALNYSIDKSTSKNGGKLPPFGINTYDRSFEEAAYSLPNNGDISKPVLTKSGWHIIKRLGKPVPDTFAVFVRRMKSQINKDQRFDAAKLKLVSDIKIAAGFREDLEELKRFTATLNEDFYSYKWSPDSLTSTKMLFSLGGSHIYTVKDFASYCKKNTKTRLKYDKSKPLEELTAELYTEYVNETAMQFEEKSLEVKYPDFKSLMREYEEGILLFEATKIHVWDKANQDTVGLNIFYEEHKANYIWPEKANVTTLKITGADRKKADKIYDYALKHDIAAVLKKFNKKDTKLEVSTVEYENGAKELTGMEFKAGYVTKLAADQSGAVFTLQKITEILPTKIKTLVEARGYVVADYQDYLEKAWLEQLAKEFNVTVNKDVLVNLKK